MADKHLPDPRHRVIKGLLDSYWLRENPSIPSLPWGPADAGALGQFLRANPKLTTDIVEECLENRLRSEDHAPAERVHRWIGDLLRYASGPLNRFKQPMRAEGRSTEASVGTYHPGESYTAEDVQQRPLREVMSPRWQEYAVHHHNHGEHLSDLERQFLQEEGLL
jgi:hypothetical protein